MAEGGTGNQLLGLSRQRTQLLHIAFVHELLVCFPDLLLDILLLVALGAVDLERLPFVVRATMLLRKVLSRFFDERQVHKHLAINHIHVHRLFNHLLLKALLQTLGLGACRQLAGWSVDTRTAFEFNHLNIQFILETLQFGQGDG